MPYPDGMTKRDWKYIDGADRYYWDDITRSCYQCGSSVPIENQEWDDECTVCGAVLETIECEPDPDAANDRRREEEN